FPKGGFGETLASVSPKLIGLSSDYLRKEGTEFRGATHYYYYIADQNPSSSHFSLNFLLHSINPSSTLEQGANWSK
ncbi:hypothetical protein LINPERPRIM_LOCUS21078, partial [Linum perenne]